MFAAARAELTSANTVLSASRAQNMAWSLYDLAQGLDLLEVQDLLTRSITGSAFGLAEITKIRALINRIEASQTNPTDHVCPTR